jgi:hypothetical protein
MALNSWESAPNGAFESGETFAKTPFRSRQFLAATTLVALLGITDIVALVRLSERLPGLPFNASVCIFLIFAVALGNWLRVMTVHRRLHKLYVSAGAENSPAGSVLDVAFRAASTLSYWGTASTAAAGLVGLGALLQVYIFMRGR